MYASVLGAIEEPPVELGVQIVLACATFGESEVVFIITAERATCLIQHLQVSLLHERRKIDAEVNLFLCHNFNYYGQS